jgi:hypothetical protein
MTFSYRKALAIFDRAKIKGVEAEMKTASLLFHDYVSGTKPSGYTKH